MFQIIYNQGWLFIVIDEKFCMIVSYYNLQFYPFIQSYICIRFICSRRIFSKPFKFVVGKRKILNGMIPSQLIIGSSIVMTVKGGPTLFGLPAFGFLGFFGAVVCGLWLVRAIWRSSRHRDDD